MNKYFHVTTDPILRRRVIVFINGSETGYSYWNTSSGPNTVAWHISEMKLLPEVKQITRIKALRIVKDLP